MLLHSLTTLAVAGGGGSGGSGGGGGLAIVALLTYIPSYYLAKLVKKLLPRRAELIVTITSGVVVSASLLIGSVYADIHGGDGIVTYLAVALVIGIWAGWSAIFFNVGERIKARSKKAKIALAAAKQKDSAWDDQQLIAYARSVFERYQHDWSTFNLAGITSYTTSQYARHSALLLSVLKELKRTNRVSDIVITDVSIVDIHDDDNNTRDTVQVAFQATVQDELIDDTTSGVIYAKKLTLVEYWTFAREGNDWKLAKIDQETARPDAMQKSMVDFAQNNGMYYSLDMGYLFLPLRGVLFEGSVFAQSDIDNHVVGTYHNHLVQMYTFTTSTRSSTTFVAQITVPKSYGGILIRRRKKGLAKLLSKLPKGYTEYTFEWPDFNSRYQVLATDADRLAAFELLNPAFMAYLYDNDSEVSIEVTDNNIYLYKDKDISRSSMSGVQYEAMLTILMKSFKELKL